ncbi:TatD family hydrolase [Campylobacterota bacterium]|nr:TatD family hydrolase [Campylobacterota bacterium]
MIIDMHCHIDLYKNPQEVIKDCIESDIYVLSVTTTPKAWKITNDIAKDAKKIRTALGFHPQIIAQRYNELELFDELLPNVKYVGEIGLDGSRECLDTFETQLSGFRRIIKSIHQRGGRIMSIHSRNAAETVLSELHNVNGISILHWFSGSKTELTTAINQGCWFSVGLPMLKSKKGKEIVSHIPKGKILTETDAPFTKHDGNISMPWDIELIFPELSNIWHSSIEDTKEQIFSNFKTLVINNNMKEDIIS